MDDLRNAIFHCHCGEKLQLRICIVYCAGCIGLRVVMGWSLGQQTMVIVCFLEEMWTLVTARVLIGV